MSEIEPSVVYRTGKLTVRDYDEAITALRGARRQLKSMEKGGFQHGCEVCSDSGHTAEHCHHNPLIVARQRADDGNTFRCFHCCFVATTADEAIEHFGHSERELAACQR